MARRALRFERLRAEAAYPHDRHDMRSCLRERLKARIFVRARRQCELASTGVALASCDPRGRVLSSARPYPSNGWVPASPLGSEDLPERQERRPVRRCARPARPHVPLSPARSPRRELSTCVVVLTVRRRRAPPITPPPTAPLPPPQPQPLPLHRRRRRRLHRRFHRHRHRPSPPRRGTAAGAARRVQGGHGATSSGLGAAKWS